MWSKWEKKYFKPVLRRIADPDPEGSEILAGSGYDPDSKLTFRIRNKSVKRCHIISRKNRISIFATQFTSNWFIFRLHDSKKPLTNTYGRRTNSNKNASKMGKKGPISVIHYEMNISDPDSNPKLTICRIRNSAFAGSRSETGSQIKVSGPQHWCCGSMIFWCGSGSVSRSAD
jgi:hypothetical protein